MLHCQFGPWTFMHVGTIDPARTLEGMVLESMPQARDAKANTTALNNGPEPLAVVRVGIAMGCDAVRPDASSSMLGREFLRFLQDGPVAGLVGGVGQLTARLAWARLAGNGTFRLEAVLAESDGSAPAASTFLLPPTTGQQLFHRADNVASMSLAVEPRGLGHEQPTALTLEAWHRFMCMAMALADAFKEFLMTQLQLATRPVPLTQVGRRPPSGPIPAVGRVEIGPERFEETEVVDVVVQLGEAGGQP
jgi:hypothetical protein